MGINRAEEAQELELVEDFKKGYVYFFNSFLNLLGSFINYVSSGNYSDQNKKDMLPIRKPVDVELTKQQKRTRDILSFLEEKNIQPESKKEFPTYFPGINTDSARLDFVQFVLTYRYLKDFYLEGTHSWNIIQKSIVDATFTDNDFKVSQLIEYRLNPGLERIKILEALLKRMGFILKLEDSRNLQTTKAFRPKFQEEVVYRLSSVFAEDFYAGHYEVIYPNPSPFPETKITQAPAPTANKEKMAQEATIKKPAPTSSKPPDNFLDASGKFSWNSNQHYVIHYDIAKYKQETDLLKSTINMDLHMGADEQVLRSEMIRSMSSLDRKTKSPEELEKEYLVFLSQFFEFCQNIVMMHIGIPGNLKWVFFFHIGPSHFYMIAKKFLTEVKTGFWHIKSSDGKKVSRFIPSEYIKKQILGYWSKSLLVNVGEEKNNLALYKKLVEIVEQKYKEATENAQLLYKALPEEIRNSKPIDLVFREHMSEWMGAANIIVYKRFVRNQIDV